MSGSVSASGSTIPISANITLGKGAFSIDNFVFNTLAQGSYPGFASYSLGKRALTFQGSATVSPEVYPFSGSIATHVAGHKRTVTFVMVDSVSGANYTFSFTASRKLKKFEL